MAELDYEMILNMTLVDWFGLLVCFAILYGLWIDYKNGWGIFKHRK